MLCFLFWFEVVFSDGFIYENFFFGEGLFGEGGVGHEAEGRMPTSAEVFR